jgi:hypothetical protein
MDIYMLLDGLSMEGRDFLTDPNFVSVVLEVVQEQINFNAMSIETSG